VGKPGKPRTRGRRTSSPTADRILLEAQIAEAMRDLTVRHRQKDAHWKLRLMGPVARPAVEEGLFADDAELRVQCTLLIDHLAGNDSFELMLLLLDDPDPRVRQHAMHALACDRCKADDVCALPAREIIDAAAGVLQRDPQPHVRAIALEALARWMHSDDGARRALASAASDDPSPYIRKKASWYLPGGKTYERTRSRVESREW
jgi:hypothetical protein